MYRRSLTLLCLILWLSCSKESPPEPPPPTHTPTIQLTVADTGVTELWLRVRFVDTTQARSFTLLRNGQVVTTSTPAPLDTVIHDGLLAPGRSYSYRAYRLMNNLPVDSTTLLSVSTMDTTSHDFMWRIDTLGESSSVLFDAAIVNDTLAYVVGDINVRDSTGFLEPPYGLAAVSTSGRQLHHLYATNPTGGNSILRPRGILAFSPTDVWLANAAVFRWDGQVVTPYWLNAFPGNPSPIFDPGQGAEKLSGTSSSNLCAVGTLGAIAFYDGLRWERKDGGTTVDLLDTRMNNQNTIWACGYRSSYSESILLRYNGSVWEEYGHSPPWGVYADLFGSVWFYKNDSAYVVGNLGVFRHAQSSRTGFRRIPIELGYFPYKIRGSARNDIAIVGDQGMIWHFNGMTWKRFDNLINPLDRLHSVSIGFNQIIAVGYRYYNGIDNYAVIYHGRR